MHRLLLSLSFLLLSLVGTQILSLVGAQKLDLPVETYTLPNGLTVTLHQDRSLPVAAVNLWFRVGSKDEPERRSGFAHLFEHLMFMGTQNAPNFDQVMEALGGSNNASTGSDRTNYFSSGPSSALPTLLWLEADRMANLGRNIDQKKLDLQRDVVLNELRQRVLESPYGQADNAITTLVYPTNHPYYNAVIGSEEDLRAATVEDVKKFFATYYVPGNATLVVAGDFDPKQVKPLIANLFKDIPRGSDVPRKAIPEARLSTVKRFVFTDKVPAGKVMMTWHSPAIGTQSDAELDLAASLLSDGFSSQLFQALVVTGLASEVTAYQESHVLSSLFKVEATAAEGVSLDKLEAALDKALQEFVQKPVSAAALRQAVSGYESGLLKRLQAIDEKADLLNAYLFYYGNPNSFERDLGRYRSATPQSVQRTAQQVLNFKTRLITHVLPAPPRADAELKIPRPSDLSQANFVLPKTNSFTLANGLKVNYWQRGSLPLMYVSAVVRGGSGRETMQNAGRANLLTAMLSRGAGPRDAEAFDNALKELGAEFDASATFEHSTISLSVPTRNFAVALGLYADAMIRPKLSSADWKTVQGEKLAEVQQYLADPRNTAREVSLQAYFGPAHPYGHPIQGSEESLKRLTLTDAQAEHKASYQPQNITLFAAGSLTLDQFRKQLETAMGGWKNTTAPIPAQAYPEPTTQKLRVLIVNRPGSTQTAIRFMIPAPKASDASSNLLNSINTIVGGSFTSRLNQNLREDKGYTYGAGSGLRQTASLGYFLAAAAVETKFTGPALKEFLAEFGRLKTADITPEEATKTAAIRRADFISGLGTLEGLIATAIDLNNQGKPFGSLETTLKELGGFNAESLNKVAPGSLPLEKGILVLVGDKEKILPQLEGLELPAPEDVK